MNYAARIMGMVDRNQVAFTSDAFRQIVDMVDDAALADRFREYPGITVKHGERISIYQYLDADAVGLNSDEPTSMVMSRDMRSVMERMNLLTTAALGSPALQEDPKARIEFIRDIKSIFDKLGGTTPSDQITGTSTRHGEEPDKSA